MKILCIVGSCSLAGNPQAVKLIEKVLTRHKPDKVISGCARGIDTMAEQAAKRRNIPFQGYPPKTQNWPGFKVRNLAMVQDCTYLTRIVSRTSTTYGSGWTRDRAAEMGKLTEEFVI